MADISKIKNKPREPLYHSARKRWVVKTEQRDKDNNIIREYYTNYFPSAKKASQYALEIRSRKGWNAFKVDTKPSEGK